MKKRTPRSGRGGDAIAAGKGATVELENSGHVSAGQGGTGGDGGAAIRVAPGVHVKIINGERGIIRGGDAGSIKNDDGDADPSPVQEFRRWIKFIRVNPIIGIVAFLLFVIVPAILALS